MNMYDHVSVLNFVQRPLLNYTIGLRLWIPKPENSFSLTLIRVLNTRYIQNLLELLLDRRARETIELVRDLQTLTDISTFHPPRDHASCNIQWRKSVTQVLTEGFTLTPNPKSDWKPGAERWRGAERERVKHTELLITHSHQMVLLTFRQKSVLETKLRWRWMKIRFLLSYQTDSSLWCRPIT
jgi:hypothetical protein